MAREKKAAYADDTYWGRPVPGFGDPEARVVILGLAPAAHGANRTGRFFTGDFLFAGLYRAGFSDNPTPRKRGDARVVVCLGAFAWDAALRLLRVKPKPKFAHGAEHAVGFADGPILLGCYHPSQQNTFTGVLTPSMLDAVLARAGDLAGGRPASGKPPFASHRITRGVEPWRPENPKD